MVLGQFLLVIISLPIPADGKISQRGGCPAGKYGDDCRIDCHCMNQTECYVENGRCYSGCVSPWDGHYCQTENLALDKPTFQKAGPTVVNSTPVLAVDGNTTTCSRTTPNTSGWWMVDLRRPIPVTRFQLISESHISLFDWQIMVGNTSSLLSMQICSVLKVHGHQHLFICDGGRTSVARFLTVLNKWGPVVLCEFKVLKCAQFRFGKNCEKVCMCRDLHEVCDHQYGTCQSGCRDGMMGRDCQQECVRSYGPGCLFRCGHCVNGSYCDAVNGTCLSRGCLPGWRGPKCDILCQTGNFGESCRSSCGHCRSGTVCDPWNGSCGSGCEAGWKGLKCDQGCPIGRHGEDCVFQCGMCVDQCDPVTGTCLSGCLAGWYGIFCTLECLSGTYGPNCENTCPLCWEGVCDTVLGECTQGCVQGWTGLFCNISCSLGTFGRDCNSTCGQCKGGLPCSITDGVCALGCDSGYNGTRCFQECELGYYGDGCIPCGFCAAHVPCDRLTGACPGECVIGYQGTTCQTRKMFMEVTNNFLEIILGLGMGCGGFVLIFVLICLVLKWRREELYPYPHTRLSL